MNQIIDGKIEIMTKISSLPEVEIDEKEKTKFFKIVMGNFKVCVTLPDKMWTRVTEGAAKYPSWVCAINGKISKIDGQEIYLTEPAVQVFENQKKPKEEKPAQMPQKKHHHNNQQQNKNQSPVVKKELEIKSIET